MVLATHVRQGALYDRQDSVAEIDSLTAGVGPAVGATILLYHRIPGARLLRLDVLGERALSSIGRLAPR